MRRQSDALMAGKNLLPSCSLASWCVPTATTATKIKKAERPSVLQRLAQFKALVRKPTIDREKRKEQVR